MIGWKCRVGYTELRWDQIKSLNDITFTDNGIFSIGTIANEYIAPSEETYTTSYGYTGTTVDSIDDLLNIFVNVLGEDYHKTYGVPSIRYTNNDLITDYGISIIRYLCPSFLVQYPNLINILRNKRAYVCMQLLSLNKLIYFGDTTQNIRIWTITPNNILSNYISLIDRVPPSSCGIYTPTGELSNSGYQACGTIILKGCDGSLDSILNSPRYALIGIPKDYNGRTAYVFYHSDTDTIIKSFIDSIFTSDNYVKPDYNEPDPYAPSDPSYPSQPDNPYLPGYLPPGTFDNSSDAIPDSPLPTLSAANTGFTRIYNPTLSQVQDLARYLWTDETVIQTIWNHIKQYFEDPMQAIIGFNLVPCAVPDAGSQSFALMYIDTGVQMNVAANQFVDVDCGSVKLERYYGSALDQSPYTRVSCFLPFIGTVKLNTDEVMETTLQVKYRIDICSGSCVAKIFVDGNVIYQYSGHCAINIPISSADFSSYVQATMSIAKLAVGAAVGGAMGAMAPSSLEPSQQTNRAVTTTRTETSTERNPATGRQVTAGTSTITTTEESHSETSTKASFDYLTPSNIANTVGQVMGSKPIVEHTGSFSGNSGYLGVRRPFLIIERPNMCLPERYQHFNGYPSMITMQLSTCNGFTKIQQVELTGMTATNPEQGEILGLLKSGVYF